MNKPEEKDPKSSNRKPLLRPASPPAWILLILAAVTLLVLFQGQGTQRDEISQKVFYRALENDQIGTPVNIIGKRVTGSFLEKDDKFPAKSEFTNEEGVPETPKAEDGTAQSYGKDFFFRLGESEAALRELETRLKGEGIEYYHREETDRSALFMFLISVGLPILLILFFFMVLRRTRDQIMGGGFLSGFSKSPAKEYEEDSPPVTFNDVAGLDSVKGDLQEIIEFLKEPVKFQRLGGRVPKGVLLMGPPGTGKTLLARAVAGEAGVPFYSVSGSEFIQMFVGVGASRVRDLFSKAKENSPSIVFVDEIDAVGRQRGAGLGGGHDEREQTLNQILSEMDGFDPSASVIVIAATNRPDVLDPALLRPGRFDRHVTVDRPTLKGRIEMFKVHVRSVPLAEDVDIKRLAEGSVGMTGADIRNMVNEAALWATRQDQKSVSMKDFEYARDKVLMGPRREEVLIGDEKEKTAYHEAGHALLAWLTTGADRVHKVTVIPRGRALGVTQTLPEEDRMNITESELSDRLAFMLGGRAAEKLIYNQYSAGAENDLERATSVARRMVTKWGMSEALGPVSYKLSDDDPFLGREIHETRQFSEATLQTIDAEVAKLLTNADHRAFGVLQEHRESLDKLAHKLIEVEELNDKQISELIGPSVHEQRDAKKRVESMEKDQAAESNEESSNEESSDEFAPSQSAESE